ncbi:aspartate aminotransferase [Corynebacterium sp. 13CS0277]|uniref:pyridoxal phosphate-dependent aminotransferase n=1 Tax=Corynebacterium sp. 13CS0277 TaxID=2071994 RepID=UPI000D04394D|nr:aminotransferase class I/II-fold pyridoxal phosphate-dependent enzyme [Corynebacterium sp. 13CS0277]PRQ11493.1 aspartate aminotransferase [Corynebacterium sp. 13CS0277]
MEPSRRSQVEPFRVMDIVGRAEQRQRTHGDAILLCVGQPEARLPEAVAAAAATAQHGYTPIAGLPALRERIARWHRETYSVATQASQVVVTTGSSGGLVALFIALLDAGAHLAITDPGYPAYRNTARALNLEVDAVPVGPDTRFQPTPELVEEYAPESQALIVTSPANPTATIISPEELGRLARWAEDSGRWLISDEIYHGMSFGRPLATARQFSQDAIVVGSMSKFFTMTGWRVGWLILPEQLVTPVENLLGNLALCPPAVSQYAALAAFDHAEEFAPLVARYERNCALAIPRLEALGMELAAPADGSFYLWLDASSLTDDAQRFCADLLDATGVALAPGADFGSTDSCRTALRMSVCGDTEELLAALERMTDWISR